MTGIDPVRWLSFAASPIFGAMGLATSISGGGAEAMCLSTHASPLNGMALMYLLMSAFHTAPWWRLVFRQISRS